ncbi:MAG: hypothetical protein WB946_00590, partial [Halobacteriota archaeon]
VSSKGLVSNQATATIKPQLRRVTRNARNRAARAPSAYNPLKPGVELDLLAAYNGRTSRTFGM